MSYVLRSFLILALSGLLVRVASSEDRPQPILSGWGEVIDPDGDCQISLQEDKVTISIPPTKHDLSAEVGDVNAPRVLRNIEGDFIVQVKVSGKFGHSGKSTTNHFGAYQGGGLLLWQDRRNYIRLERAVIVDEDGTEDHYANFELRKDARRIDIEEPSIEMPNQDTYLRLERRKGHVIGSVSVDDVHWQLFEPFSVDLSKELKLGIGAINTSTKRFKAEFSDLEVFRKEKR